jgi:uncharacterized protein YegL
MKRRAAVSPESLLEICGICFESLATRSFTTNTCGHVFCDKCLLNAVAKSAKQPSLLLCGICKAPIAALQIEAPGSAAHLPTVLPQDKRARVIAPRPSRFYAADADLPSPPEATSSAHVVLSHATDAAGGVVTFTVGALQSPPARVRLVCLVDVSSSMAGLKLSMLSRTLIALLNELDGSDRLSLVAFSRDARLIMPLRVMHAAGKVAARLVIDDLATSRGTNICAALEVAGGVLETSAPAASVTACLLLTDGQDENPAGAVQAALALKKRCPVFTLGLGVGHDHQLLSRIAMETGGVFSYAEAPEAIASAVGTIVGGIKTCVGFDAALQVTPLGVDAADTARAIPIQRLLSLGQSMSFLCPALCDVVLSFTRPGPQRGGAGLSERLKHEVRPIAAAGGSALPAAAVLSLATSRARESVSGALMQAARAASATEAAAILDAARAALGAGTVSATPEGVALFAELRLSSAAIRTDRAVLASSAARVGAQAYVPGVGALSASMVGASVRMHAATLCEAEEEEV